MDPFSHLHQLAEMVKSDSTPRVAVAAGQDPDTILAINRAVKEDIVQATLIGDEIEIQNVCKEHQLDTSQFKIVHVPDPVKAAVEAVRMVRVGEADMLMKGLVKTAQYMKAILDKENGILPKGALLSHVALIELPAYPKVLIVSDAAIIPNPDLDQKIQILKYQIEVAHGIGLERPKAALISATETISFKMQSSVDAAVITAMAQRKQIKGVTVDGPLALDVALSPRHCKLKGLDSPINGEADILMFPNIDTANTFYKTSTLLAQGHVASMVCGTIAPVVLTSRADSDESKFYSIVLAARMAAYKKRSED